MADDAPPPRSFDPASLSELDEPVRRCLTHALSPGAAVDGGRRFRMAGRIRVGRWLAFDAEQTMAGTGHAFAWTARAGVGRFRPLRVVDRYRDGLGATDGRLGRIRFLHAEDRDTARSAAGRAAVESVLDPASLLPIHGVRWQAEGEDRIVARFDVPPEAAEVRLRIDARGALRSVETMRWGDVGRDGFGYIPFGGDVHAERAFGDLVLPSELTIGWWYGTRRYSPFFVATMPPPQDDGPGLSPAALAFRATHGLITVAFLGAIARVWWSALTGRRDRRLWLAVAALVAEGAFVAANDGDCPLGPLQDRLGDPVPLLELVLSPVAARRAVPVLGAVAAAGIAVVAVRRPSAASGRHARPGGATRPDPRPRRRPRPRTR